MLSSARGPHWSALARRFRWEKLGHVFTADNLAPWARSHAYCPTLLARPDGTVRVYAAFLDDSGIGRVGYVDIDPARPGAILDVSTAPALDIGRPGAFDDHGVTPLAALSSDGTVLLLYAGWRIDADGRYELFTGLAMSPDGTTFSRQSTAPVLPPMAGESALRSSASVVPCGDKWCMWYSSSDGWERCADGRTRPRYGLRLLRSGDPTAWDGQGVACRGLQPRPHEIGLARPCVLRSEEQWHMWFSYRSTRTNYRVGYAVSANGLDWDRCDKEAGIDVGQPDSWDANAVGLGSIAHLGDDVYMAYNGSDLGATGFGLAILRGAP